MPTNARGLLMRIVCGLLLAWLAVSASMAAEESLGIRVPEGFVVSLYADDALAHNIYSMTIDAQGRVVVAGPGYVKILHDSDGDGRADRATLFADVPKSGAHGLCFDGRDLICTGDNAVMRLRDDDGDDMADGPGEVWTNLRHPEHGANGLVQGPDGWFYLICGNDAGVSREHAMGPSSPVKEPRCGAIVRFSPDGKRSEVVAHGFRNPYDLDFNAHGQLFTVDADGERDHHLPWYAPNRLFDVAQGMEHGWLLAGWQRSWNRPESYFDNVERLVEIGRGSPTGLVVYRHRQFPERYRGGVLSACWTLGRVYHLPIERAGATYRGELEVFMETAGDVGFAPVDLAVGPEGDLFVAVGGRGTQGSVFRVRYAAAEARPVRPEDPLRNVLAADQPLASWSRARWVPLARQLGPRAFLEAMVDAELKPRLRIRAVEVLTELFEGVPVDWARQALAIDDRELSARLAWSLARCPQGPAGEELLTELTHDGDPLVLRAAWEALGSLGRISTDLAPQPAWQQALRSEDRRVRAAVVLAAAGPGWESFEQATARFAHGGHGLEVLARLRVEAMRRGQAAAEAGSERSRWDSGYFEACLRCLGGSRLQWLEAIRLIQIGLGDLRVQPGQPEVYSGYLANALEEVDEATRLRLSRELAARFPHDDPEVNRELGRLLAMLAADDPRLPDKIAARWTDDSTPEDDIHYLIILSRLPATRSSEVTERTARALARLHGKMAAGKKSPSRNWPLRVGEMFEELCRRDERLAEALVHEAAFGQPEHSLLAARMPGGWKVPAARRLLERCQAADPEQSGWTSELVRVVGVLPDAEVLPVLRGLWDDVGLRDAIAVELARRPAEIDRAKLVAALESTQAEVVSQAAAALEKLAPPGSPEEVAMALGSLKQHSLVKEQRPVREALGKLLAHWTGERIEVRESSDPLSAWQPWFDWFAKKHPEHSAMLSGFSGVEATAWKARLAAIDWSRGEAARGRHVFEKKACHRCHQGGGKLGPDLAGAAGRFSREDLFSAIVDPNKEVAPLYQTTLVATQSGKVYHGLVVYESPEGTLLQTGPDTTVRITGAELATMARSRQSIMPTGLLNDTSDQELADLYAYLRTLVPE